MEKHQWHGVIIEDVERANAQVVAALSQYDCAQIGDAMGRYGVADHRIKPLEKTMKLCGSALTVLTRPGDALYVQAAIDIARPGDVVVIDASGGVEACVIGERLSFYFQKKGVVGVVVDGAVRDAQGVVDMGMSCFARGINMKIWGSDGPGAVNVPVQCGGVTVNPGDVVVGDRDGVVFIPRNDAKRVLELTAKHLEGELERVRAVESGQSVTEVFELAPKLARWAPNS